MQSVIRDESLRVLVVIGTRPEAIKMAPVYTAFRRRPGVEVRLALTGQHTSLVDQVLSDLDMRPDYNLDIMKEGQDLYDVAHGCLDGLRSVVQDFLPQVVLVQGDTATVFYASLVSFFENVAVGHVEAGLRSGRKRSPFPEEMLRRLTDVIADYHFAPTSQSAANLVGEGHPEERVYVTGNTVVDALKGVAARDPEPENEDLAAILASGRRLVLLTAHRRESFGDPIREVFAAVRDMVDGVEDVEVLYPVHPNPRVRRPAEEMLSDHPRIRLTEPLSYVDLVLALRSAEVVLTDSGGIQEEAPTFGTPVLVLREVTERGEGVDAGVARLVGTERGVIREAGIELLTDAGAREVMARASNPYGDGKAADRIADILVASFTGRPRETQDWTGGIDDDQSRDAP